MDINDFAKYPLYKSIIELNEEMERRNIPPIELNVVGGFALMIHKMRNRNDNSTDIDFVGPSLSQEIKNITNEISIRNNLVKDWLNNDLMLTGSTLEDIEFSTGRLTFNPAFELSRIKINVATLESMIKLKVIAIDTALTAVDNSGDFSRYKDFADIINLMKKTGLGYDDIGKMLDGYIINPNTLSVIKEYEKSGREGVEIKILLLQREALDNKIKIMSGEALESKTYVRSSFTEDLLNNLITKSKEKNYDSR